jgi:hypothetical protein
VSEPAQQAVKPAWQLLAAMAAGVLPLLTGDGPSNAAEWINAVLVALGAGSVYIAANQPKGTVWHYTKTIMSALAAAGVVANSALTDGVTSTEWYQIAAALVGTGLVYWIPNDVPLPTGRHAAPED